MNLAARVLMIIAAIFAVALFAFGIASIYLIIAYASDSSSEVVIMVNKILENNHLIGENSFFAMFLGDEEVEGLTVVTIIASYGIAFGLMSIPCAISCLNAIKRHTTGRFIACIVTGGISLNLLAIVAGIVNLVAKSRDRSY